MKKGQDGLPVKLTDFDYPLDVSLIAQHPSPLRDEARLLVFDRKADRMEHRLFSDLPDYLRPEDVLVVNDSRVRMARLEAQKEGTGGRLEVLLVRRTERDIWEALISGRCRAGMRVRFRDGSAGEIVSRGAGGRVCIRLDVPGDFEAWLERTGSPPLPPYIRRRHGENGGEALDRERYQTVYAACLGSIAAPTAGLHFTPSLLDGLARAGVQVHSLTLHVGPGTFTPVRTERIEDHVLEEEALQIPAATVRAVRRARSLGRRVVAVGTTTTRALEAAAAPSGELEPLEGKTDLFIRPDYRFRVVDGLITNFHLPRSTLLMLVCAFVGHERLFAVYQEAVRERYRFYSYGDAMLVL